MTAVRRSARQFALPCLLAVLLTTTSCHRFDKRQVPVVTVSRGLRPAIAWTPSPAYMLSVYEGEQDGDGLGVIWSATGSGGYENRLQSPVIFGVPPENSEVAGAPPLEPGRTYTVTVFRKDERGSGEGFSNTRHRYVGVLTFVASE
jgi:hypothetical protein